MPFIDKWKLVAGVGIPVAPEEVSIADRRVFLFGTITGHPQLSDGIRKSTSYVVAMVDGKVQTRSGTIFELGEVDPVYGKDHADAKSRLASALAQKGATAVPEVLQP